MSVLFGHPSGSPFSHHAALAHFEEGRLEAFCVPWMPSRFTVGMLRNASVLRPLAERFARRRFEPLANAPLIQGRGGEFRRLAVRALGWGDEGLSYEANDWLMRTMARESRRASVTAVHSYEDCSLWQFEAAKRSGKACLYESFYPAWETEQADLAKRFSDWLPDGGVPPNPHARPAQKRREMELADLVLAPSRFIEKTILGRHPGKKVARVAYAVDREFWSPSTEPREDRPLRFIYAGQASLRKATPLLLAAWNAAGLPNAELELVGQWQLAEAKRLTLPAGAIHIPPCSSEALRARYRAADAFVFPPYFEGFGLVLLEAMACGLPVIASEASGGPDVVTPNFGRLIRPGDLEALVESFRWFAANRDRLPAMGRLARAATERFSWENYRHELNRAVAPFI